MPSTQTPKIAGTSAAVPVSNTSVVTAAATSVSAVDKAAGAGISETTRTRGAIITDFNNDGKSDIFLGRTGTDAARLYINDGSGHFTEIDKGTFKNADRHGVDAADVNGDGLMDIFSGQGAHHGTAEKTNQLYIQRPDHTFVEVAGQYGVLDPFGRGRLAAFINANGDDRPDLFVANEADRLDAMPSPNQLFINQGARSAPPQSTASSVRWTSEQSPGKISAWAT